ncbi:sugar phosphate isomerase/epimerase [Mucilaginibacter pallidiroseus]|uniref:Sugar phosphate isomerase/epimerase n=1 Tax=Mucilaginibacter pallidiroseus TaxID=2599295 RepID=A0A563UJ42_9SPHI|nr:sugar phosphate isomerase/epimerase [Mucilaginibacter pallidiroseus]TWR31392.1 sugar phosphate isomerase/epimerase [Mucilaginibacter pallidiroseus]
MNLNRRNFIKGTGAAVLSGVALSGQAANVFNNFAPHPIGVQLFTFFNVIDADVKGTLSKIATDGFTELESAFSKKGGYYGMKPKEFKAMANDLGLKWKSHHVLGAPFKMPKGAKMPLDADGKPMVLPVMRNLTSDMQQLVDEAAEGGVKYLVCANIPTGTLEEVKAAIPVLNKTGEACKKAGLQFAYHNHDMEFKPVEDGSVPYDMFLKETDAKMVKMELDLAWTMKAGKNPVDLFKAHPGRFPLWHLKDLDASRENIMPVGSGTLDFKPVFAAAKIAGMDSFFVEHDMPKDPYESVAASIKYVKANFI